MTKTYHFEELDQETRDYLLQARDDNGKGMPGIFASRPNYLPVIGLVAGFGIMVLTVLFTLPPTGHPAKEALLQTAGFLLGGWLVVAALRVWMAGKAGKYAGHFVYADPEFLYVAKGGVVEVTDLAKIRDAKAVENFNDDKYQNTTVTVKVGKHRQEVVVHDEDRGRRLAAFLNAVAYMRDGGEDGKDEELRNLSPEAMGVVARKVAKTGEFPRRVRDADDGSIRIPQPQPEGRPSTGLLAILATVVVGLLLFVGFRTCNAPIRDRAVFDRIQSLPPQQQPPALRLYLTNPKFTAHRDEAQRLLGTHYDNAVRSHVNGTDPDAKRGFSEVVLSLKSSPAPVISLVTEEQQPPPGQQPVAASREKVVQTQLADKWGSTVGDELVVFAAPANPDKPEVMDKSVKGMIDLRWRYAPDGSLEYTLEFRTSPAEKPILTRTGNVPAGPAGDPVQQADATSRALIEQVLQTTVGTTRIRPLAPADF